MRSSGSTPSPRPSDPIRRFVLVLGDDHPRACTGRRLIRQGLASAFPSERTPSFPPVVLDPFASDPLSRADRPVAERGGVVAVDCSWNRISDRGGLPRLGSGRRSAGLARRLPLLVATNPQHYGRLAELNTVEALAASLCVLGRPEEGRSILEGFAGGPAFFEVNRERLRRYARAPSADAVRAAERALHAGPSRPTRLVEPGGR